MEAKYKTVDNNLSFDLDELTSELSTETEIITKDRDQDIDLEFDPEYVADYWKSQFVEDIYKAMENSGINKKKLAEILKKSRQYVGRVLNENANFTIETMSMFSCALKLHFEINIIDPEEQEMDNEYLFSTPQNIEIFDFGTFQSENEKKEIISDDYANSAA